MLLTRNLRGAYEVRSAKHNHNNHQAAVVWVSPIAAETVSDALVINKSQVSMAYTYFSGRFMTGLFDLIHLIKITQKYKKSSFIDLIHICTFS